MLRLRWRSLGWAILRMNGCGVAIRRVRGRMIGWIELWFERTVMLKCKTAITALTLAAIPLTSVVAQTLAPSPVFEGKIATPTKDGAMQPLQVSIQSWAIAGQG